MNKQVYEVTVVGFDEEPETFRVKANSQKEAQQIAENLFPRDAVKMTEEMKMLKSIMRSLNLLIDRVERDVIPALTPGAGS